MKKGGEVFLVFSMNLIFFKDREENFSLKFSSMFTRENYKNWF